jgi:hypothetical protein
MRAEDRAKALAKVEKLAQIAKDLRAGRAFTITRLTVLKSLCQDPVATVRFSLYLTERNRSKAKKRFRPLINRAVAEAKDYLQRPRRQLPERVYQALQELHDSQNEIEHHRWADIRIIRCREALLAEYMLRCITQPRVSAYWGYQTAAFYVERYDPRYGTGLIPESAPAVEEIVRFWSRYYRVTSRASSARRQSRAPAQ